MNKLVEALLQAYVGESQARNRYDFHSKIAKKEGYVQISQIFSETAGHEKTHGKNYYRMAMSVMKKLGEEIDMAELNKVGVPIIMGNTIENLKSAIAGEHHEATEMYPKIAKIAEEEGFPKVAEQVLAIAEAETHHEARFKRLLEQIEKGSIFEKDGDVWWLCIECGYWHKGKFAPENCISCNHPQAYFKVMDEVY